MPKIRVLIVDDAVVMRRMITEVLGRDPDIEVVGAAPDGRIALQKVIQVNPDVITMDVEMPGLNGIDTVRELRKTHPKIPVIMFSTLTARGAEATLDALAVGATDYVTKPANVGSITEGIARLEKELIPKIKLHCRKSLPPTSLLGAASAMPSGATVLIRKAQLKTISSVRPEIVCIGASTGGPNALADVFAGITTRLPVPVVIVQHMPALFTKMLAERLAKGSVNRFFEGAPGMVVEPGSVYIAPGGFHMEVRSDGAKVKLHLHEGPPENSCRPAVDVLFRSVAAVYGSRILGIILTGMGQDGLHGSRVIKENGGTIFAQDKETSVVWGMPGVVANADLADRILPLRQISGELLRRLTPPMASVAPKLGGMVRA